MCVARKVLNSVMEKMTTEQAINVLFTMLLTFIWAQNADVWRNRFCLWILIYCCTAVGCSDLVPPSDAWLKRTDNVATVGCYMTRQTWILTCDHNSRWTGTFGNCTQRTPIFIHSTSCRKM